jgi:hypothetical protein
MKLFNGLFIAATLAAGATAANAQVLAPYEIGGSPYAVGPEVEGRYGPPPGAPVLPRYDRQMMLLPPQEVYAVVRDSGFSPLGVPQQRGLVYTIAVIDRGGEDGRLVIDARNGRIIRFMPAYRMGDNLGEALTTSYGPVVPLVSADRSRPRPPASIPHASRSLSGPLPKPLPSPSGGARAAQQSAVVQAKPADAQTAPQASAPAMLEAKRPPQIMPTQELPKVQGLD